MQLAVCLQLVRFPLFKYNFYRGPKLQPTFQIILDIFSHSWPPYWGNLEKKTGESKHEHKAALKKKEKAQRHRSSGVHLRSWGFITETPPPHTRGHIDKNLRLWRQRNRTQSKGLRTWVCACVCVHLAWLLRLSESIVTEKPAAPIPLICNKMSHIFLICTEGFFRTPQKTRRRWGDYKMLQVCSTSEDGWQS